MTQFNGFGLTDWGPFGWPGLSTSELALSIYAVNGLDPDYVLDFIQGRFRVNTLSSTLGNAATFARSGNATMFDSDGVLKWAPHNLVAEDSISATGADLSKVDGIYSLVENESSGVHNFYLPCTTAGVSTLVIELKPAGRSKINMWIFTGGINILIDVENKTFSNKHGELGVPIFEDVSNGFTKISITTPSARPNANTRIQLTDDSGSVNYIGDGVSGLKFRKPRIHHSDLGGMVNNPATSDSYVPTVASPVYLPREGSHIYEGGAWVNNGLQLESEVRTNLLSYSQDYTNGVWLKGANVTVSGNTDISPDGSQNADRLYEAATTASHALVSEVVSFSPGNSHTASIYAKNVPGGRGLLQIAFFQALSGNVTTYANFDLINGVVTVESGCTATMEDVGNGFYRCRLTFVQGGRTSERVNLVLINSTTAGTFQSYAGDTSKAIILGGSQFEIASTPSSYIPTSGSTVTRAAETLTASAANLPWPTPVETTGIELVTNGDFANGTTGWSIYSSGTFSSSSGVLEVESTSNNYRAGFQGFSTVIGKTYKISGTIVSFTNIAELGKSDSNTSVNSNKVLVSNTVGTSSGVFTATATTSYVFLLSGLTGSTASFSGISVKEINPLSVSIQISGKMNYSDGGGGNGDTIVPVYWYFNSTNRITSAIATITTRTGQVTFTQVASGTNDNIQGSQTSYAGGLNVPFNLASRHGSTFINGAIDGTLLTVDTTPVAFPDLENTDLQIAQTFMGHVHLVRVWAVDIGNTGIEVAST